MSAPASASQGPAPDRRDAAGCSWRRAFGDVDEQAVSLDSLYPQRYQQLGHGRFRGEMIRIDLDGVIVVRERVNRRLMQTGSMRTPSIGWLIESEGRFRFNRQELEPQSAIFYRQGSEFEIQATPSDLIGIAVVPERLAAGVALPESLCNDAAREGVRRLPSGLFARLQQAARRALALLEASDAAVLDAAQCEALRFELIALMGAVAALPRAGEPNRHGRERTLERAVRAAQREISIDLAGNVPIEALCRRIGVSRRNLFYAFDELLGLSPHRYRHALRLNAVRRALKVQSHADAAIADLAWRAGFAHPSRFAADYRQLFGERPSDTLRRARDRALDPAGAD